MDHLAACGIDKSWLTDKVERHGANGLFSDIKSKVLEELPRQSSDVDSQARDCCIYTGDWMAVERIASSRKRRASGDSLGGSSRFSSSSHLQSQRSESFGPKTPPESPLSGSSSDDEMDQPRTKTEPPSSHGDLPQVPRGLEKLARHLEDKVSYAKSGSLAREAPRIAREMVGLLHRAGHDDKTLEKMASGVSSDNSREIEKMTDRLERDLIRRERSHPSSWNGLSLEFLARNTLKYCQSEASNQLQTPSKSSSAVLTSSIDSFLSEQRHAAGGSKSESPAPSKREIEVQEQNDADDMPPVDQATVGLGNLRRKLPQSDLRLLSDFLRDFEAEADDLEDFVDEQKANDPMMADSNSRFLILELLKNLTKNKMEVKSVRDRLKRARIASEAMTSISESIFGASNRKGKSKKTYQASSDFDFYRLVLDKLMEVLLSGASNRRATPRDKKEPSKRKTTPDDKEVEKEAATPGDVMKRLKQYLDALMSEYRRNRTCVIERRAFHSYVYFSSEIRSVFGGNSQECGRVANAIVEHMGNFGMDEKEVAKSVRDLPRDPSFKSACRAIVLNKLNMVEPKSVPLECQPIYGLLCNVVVRYFEEEMFLVTLSPAMKALEFPSDETNGLQELQDYFVRCLATALKKMVEDDGDVTGVSFQSMNLDPLVKVSAQWTEELLSAGFVLYGAISSFMDGSFFQDFKHLLDTNSQPLQAISRPNVALLLAKLTSCWIDRYVRQRDLDKFPGSKPLLKTLKNQIVVLLRTTDIVPEEDKDKMTVNFKIPPRVKGVIDNIKLGVNKQVPISEVKPTNLNEQGDLQAAPEVPTEKMETGIEESGGEAFVDVPGPAITSQDIVIAADSAILVKLWLCGFPRLRSGVQLNLLPNTDAQV